jgi:hypothetical protein
MGGVFLIERRQLLQQKSLHGREQLEQQQQQNSSSALNPDATTTAAPAADALPQNCCEASLEKNLYGSSSIRRGPF